MRILESLRKLSKKKNLELVINENRSTMLSIHPKTGKLSLHKMFLDAPEPVIAAVAHYVRGTRRDAYGHKLTLRAYIQDNLARFDHSHRLDRSKLVQKGRVYDLQPLYEQINRAYFSDALKLELTWYGVWGRNNRSRVTFGQYVDNLRLIKIHRILDDPFFPLFFVRFILYHEMLHAVIPGQVDQSGRYCMHGKAFKERERLFADYAEARAWEKQHKHHFFKG